MFREHSRPQRNPFILYSSLAAELFINRDHAMGEKLKIGKLVFIC